VPPAAEQLTFVFTDIEGSTRLLAAAEDAYPALLDGHRAIIRAHVEAHGGMVDSTDGDATFAVFTGAPAAVAAAVAVQRSLLDRSWPGAGRVRVRTSGGVVSFEVHRAARIAASAHGGQVVMSDHAKAEGGGRDVGLIDLGLHRFKDIEEPTRIHQLVADGLPVDFPRLNSLTGRIHHLPSAATPLVGRDDEVAQVSALLEAERLVTVLGPGGVGKTSLATHVAADALRRFPDGIWFVDLTRVREASLVPDEVAEILDIDADRAPVRAIVDACHDRRMLVVVDNVEHVVDASAMFEEVVAGTNHLTVLATSRERLRLPSERVFVLEPLTDSGPELFVRRARMVEPSLRFTDAELRDVDAVCAALDGLPLAIELAASTVRLLSPAAIRERLTAGLGVVPVGTRGGPARQRTIADTIRWSVDLLDRDQRTLFTRLAVFPTARPLDAIESVCGVGLQGGALPALGGLIDKSLVTRRTGSSGEPRFAMLELVQEFAHDRFTAGGDAPRVRARLARWAADLAVRLDDELWGADVEAAFTRLHDQATNLRVAVPWAFEHDPVLAGRIVGGLAYFWFREQRDATTMGWVRTALTIDGLDDASLARLCNGLAYDRLFDGDLDAASSAWARAAEHGALAGHDRLRLLGTICRHARIGDVHASADVLVSCERATAEAEARGFRTVAAQGHNIVGEMCRLRGDHDRAERGYLAALELAEAVGDLRRQSMQYQGLSFLAYHRGDGARALALGRKALVLQERMHGAASPNELQTIVGPLILVGQTGRAALLFGAGQAEFERLGQMPPPGDKPEYEHVRARLDVELGATAAARAIARGRALSRTEATRLALDLTDVEGRPRSVR
jgi:predicted ATPase